MKKYINTKDLVSATTEMLNEISSVYTAVVFMCNADYIDDSDFDDIDTAMTRLIGAWEELRRTPKERMTE